MWTSTVGLVNGKHRYLTAETFGFKINSNGQALKKRQQWTIEPFPDNLGPDGSISSAASVSSSITAAPSSQQQQQQQQSIDPNDPTCILTLSSGFVGSSLTSVKSSSNGSSTSANSEQDGCGEEHEQVAIKSHLNKYLAVDSFGNVTCDSEEKTENARFTITICSMSQGRSKDEHIFWAFKNVERGYFLGTTDDGMVCCNAKMPKSRNELWHLHLLPARGASFFVLKSLGRKRFARVVAQKDNNGDNNNTICSTQVQLDATITWGPETLFQFKYFEGGRYALLTSDCLYLTNEGKCIEWKQQQDEQSNSNSNSSIGIGLPPPECLFTLEYHSGYLAFRDSFSHYLAAAGRSSVLRSRSIGVSRDELFSFEGAPIQVSLKATFNNRLVSIKQGVDVSANQTETTSKFETFQMTYHKQTQNWSIMTHECGFWTASQTTSTISVCKPGDYEGLVRGQFKLIWSDSDGSCSLKFVEPNSLQERWISARKSGQLFLAPLNAGPNSAVQFIMRFQNRRLLNLRPVDGSGFVGLKAATAATTAATTASLLSVNCKQLEANKTSPDSIAIEYVELAPAQGENSTCLGAQSASAAPVPVESFVDCSSHDRQRFNMFNVKLNSVKGNTSISSSNAKITRSQPKEIELFGIDDNNNGGCLMALDRNQTTANSEETTTTTTTGQEAPSNGSVESAAAPSVASIISSFSSVKVTNGNGNGIRQQQQQQQQQAGRTNSTVFKLASNFDSAGQQQQQQSQAQQANESDAASVITSCSATSSSGAGNSSSGGSLVGAATSACSPLSADHQQAANNNKPLANCPPNQLAQFECCYLKSISNDRYLVVSGGGNGDSSIVCDATNRACAQAWLLELRSHNSIAIRASDNHAYVQLGTNGTIYLSRCDPKEASLWEF